eukprot:TRINITY_DN316_c0_g1_i16.p1 TRINITY_DN316_c0_g1~~TRINITY_DN316_c0_g1_i16.p1  ORF type:complete len:115 (+),score=39.59 TRINITY_DN316_c0_g1_i16:95-439(+)
MVFCFFFFFFFFFFFLRKKKKRRAHKSSEKITYWGRGAGDAAVVVPGAGGVATVVVVAVAVAVAATGWSVVFIAGNRMTSLMLFVLVSIIVSRSMPRPHPAVGGSPCSRAVMKP